MDHERYLTFGPFRLDVAHGRVWRGEQVTALRPRSVAMLRYLVEHPRRLVTKAELRQHVWGGTHVTDTVLRVCVQEIRAALRDSATAPSYLETVERQGYRLLVGGDLEVPPALMPGPLVGRQREVEALERWFQRAAQGTRQLVLVSGEAGVGKTTVVDLFLARLGVGSAVRMARGQCVEQYGEGEPYLPVLEALGQLSRGPGHRDVLAALRRYAPMWLVQLPGLLPEVELERLQRQVQGATPARMLRELAEVLEVLTAEALTLVATTEARWWEAELSRLRGELLLQHPRQRCPRRKPVCVRRWMSPAASRRRCWSFAWRSVSVGCGSVRGSVKQPVNCWQGSTTGSRRALTHRTCKRPRRCWKSCPDDGPERAADCGLNGP